MYWQCCCKAWALSDADMPIDMCMDMRIDVRIDMRIDMCIDVCVDRCLDMGADVLAARDTRDKRQETRDTYDGNEAALCASQRLAAPRTNAKIAQTRTWRRAC